MNFKIKRANFRASIDPTTPNINPSNKHGRRKHMHNPRRHNYNDGVLIRAAQSYEAEER
jgi:hypothetical protein